ncbi:MAG: DUF4203 domain-containing protein [Anaerolineae bacterium]|jgi:hypothetical protein|nr:DUF4203 domain-containing protein [Anaerolineae bacterium]MBT7070007.1 DUF4203 domain-containing protein [Anaerolineae bacterium]MBT7325673.1 DUF4203 domain-containing protein [Anaerolineae bacterium]
MEFFDIILGAALLFYGRKVFWLFVGVLGFQSGLTLFTETFRAPNELGMILAVGVGIIAALLAIFLKKTAIGLAGLLAGASLASILAAKLPSEFSWIVILVGAILGVVVLMALFDWALIILSALVGAGMILEASASSIPGATLIFILLVIFGIGIQMKILQKEG